jgi:hypothetical protein
MPLNAAKRQRILIESRQKIQETYFRGQWQDKSADHKESVSLPDGGWDKWARYIRKKQ